MSPSAPTFQKTNHHTVPRFWQRSFAASDGRIFARYRRSADPVQSKATIGTARPASTKQLMAKDWVYTVFDQWWRPSDEVENRLSQQESKISKAINALELATSTMTPELTWDLCRFVGLAVCRTPEAMARGHRRLKELALAFADVHEASSLEDYADSIRDRFGVALSARDLELMRSRSQPTWIKQAEDIQQMSAQNPLIPEQIALSGVDAIAATVGDMELILLEAPAGRCFVLGDTPLPDADLAMGFTVPLTKTLALEARPRVVSWSLPTRKTATSNEVAAVNQAQYDRSRDVVIGPEAAILDALS